MPPVDIAIIGAGPAGVAAAVAAQRLGLSTIVLDKATFPRDKCCGDGLTALALRELELIGVDPGRFDSWEQVDDIALRSPDGRRIDLPLPRDRGVFSAVVRRREFDHGLVEHARSIGIEVVEGATFRDLDQDLRAGRVTCSFDGAPEVVARYVVAADGMWSPVRKASGAALEGYLGDWHAFRQYRTSTGTESRKLWVWFDEDLLPGYAWSFPLPDNRINVGFGIVRDGDFSGKELREIWAGLVDRPHIREVIGDSEAEEPHRAWPIPARTQGLDLFAGRVLFAGDAAAVTDPMTGEGIGQALESGRLAASAIAQGGPSRAVARRYEQLVQDSIQTDNRLAERLSEVLARPRLAELALRAVDSSDWSRRNFARWMFEDYPRAALFTPRRWRAGLFSSPGAFAPAD